MHLDQAFVSLFNEDEEHWIVDDNQVKANDHQQQSLASVEEVELLAELASSSTGKSGTTLTNKQTSVTFTCAHSPKLISV